jgi:hypothetical protein
MPDIPQDGEPRKINPDDLRMFIGPLPDEGIDRGIDLDVAEARQRLVVEGTAEAIRFAQTINAEVDPDARQRLRVEMEDLLSLQADSIGLRKPEQPNQGDA